MTSPDVMVSGTYDFSATPVLVDSLLRSPLLLSRLWTVYDYYPHYKVRLQGDAIHVDDPTGISGDLFLVEQSSHRRVYLGIGALNHRLVPAFSGKMALVMTVTPKGSRTIARMEVSVRTDSRMLGFFARTFLPLVRGRIQNRMSVHARDIGAIFDVLTTAPRDAVSRLSKEEGGALLKILQAPAKARGGI